MNKGRLQEIHAAVRGIRRSMLLARDNTPAPSKARAHVNAAIVKLGRITAILKEQGVDLPDVSDEVAKQASGERSK